MVSLSGIKSRSPDCEVKKKQIYFIRVMPLSNFGIMYGQACSKGHSALQTHISSVLFLLLFQIFLQMIKEWPHTLYNIKTIINVVIERLDKDRNNKILLQALAEL